MTEQIPKFIDSFWDMFRKYIVISLVVMVALAQFRATRIWGLSQWKGGGFGMFSSIDAPETRTLKVYFGSDNDSALVAIPETYDYERRLATSMPTSKNLESLVILLLNDTFVSSEYNPYSQIGRESIMDDRPPPLFQILDQEAIEVGLPDLLRTVALEEGPVPESEDVSEQLKTFRIEVWKRSYNATTNKVTDQVSEILTYSVQDSLFQFRSNPFRK